VKTERKTKKTESKKQKMSFFALWLRLTTAASLLAKQSATGDNRKVYFSSFAFRMSPFQFSWGAS